MAIYRAQNVDSYFKENESIIEVLFPFAMGGDKQSFYLVKWIF
jgi:hypothetical protein